MNDEIHDLVRARYGEVARSSLSTERGGVEAVAKAFGYSAEQLASIPAESNLGLSCGNPTAFASLKQGEVVVDLGSGGGLDVFLAAERVGPHGRAIGIDMTAEMVELARNNAARGQGGKSPSNIEFHHAQIESMPLEDATVDCVISNCVINLAPDKRAVLNEVYRVLKPGGRLAISDIALKKPLPEELNNDLMAYVGCISGAIEIDEYRRLLEAAGFTSIDIVDTKSDLNAYAQVENQAGCCTPAMSCGEPALPIVDLSVPSATSESESELHTRLFELLQLYNVNDFAASVRVYALKE